MTPLAKAVLKAATTALAHRGTVPVTGHALSDCREDARAVAVSVQVAVGDAMARPGLHPSRRAKRRSFWPWRMIWTVAGVVRKASWLL